MKKIIFVRHGKAEQEAQGLSDFERSLTSNGKMVSKQMAQLFRQKEPSPGLFISSPAFRALETALIFAGETGVSYDSIIMNSKLYYGTNLEKLLKILSGLDDEVGTITIFGHNPSFSDMPQALSRTGCDPLPKTAVVCLSFEVESWKEVGRKSGRVDYFLNPKNLG